MLNSTINSKDIPEVKVGDTIHIVSMKDEPRYTDKEGKVTHIDSIGQLHGTWGGLAVIPGEDEFYIVGGGNEQNTDESEPPDYAFVQTGGR